MMGDDDGIIVVGRLVKGAIVGDVDEIISSSLSSLLIVLVVVVVVVVGVAVEIVKFGPI
jgi:hypothetical protein